MLTETGRIEAFSDGVFAVAITLLIFAIHLPTSPPGSLAYGLLRQWPTYVSFLLSFSFIGIMGVNHRRLFNHIRRADNLLLFWNLLLLMGVTVVPFPPALLANHYFTPGDRNLLWYHAVRNNLLDSATLESANSISKQYAIGPLSYLVCLGLVWISIPASIAGNAILAIFFAIPPQKSHHGAGGDARCHEIVAFLDSPVVR
jgi:uncharacterized membrane protein